MVIYDSLLHIGYLEGVLHASTGCRPTASELGKQISSDATLGTLLEDTAEVVRAINAY